MTQKQKRVRARVVLLGDTFRPVVDKLGPKASAKTVALASTMVDHIHQEPNRVVRMAEAKDLTGLSRSSLIRKAADPKDDFPAAIRVGKSSRGWHLWEVLDWIRGRTRI